MFKKIIRKAQGVLLRWHRKRYNHYLAKCLGATYYRHAKTALSSTYGITVGGKEYEDIYKAFHFGETHAKPVYADIDSVSAYPSVIKSCRFPLVNQPGSK